MTDTREIIVRLLSNLGSSREVNQYLKQFASVEANQFAVIKVGGGIIRNQLQDLASALTFLRRVGLFPIVIHGGGPQLDEALKEAGVESQTHGGLRITTRDVLEVARRTMQRVNLELVDALEALGTRARPITGGVFEAEMLDAETLGFVGEVTSVHLDPIHAAIRAHHLPVVTCFGESAAGQILNINADIAARELAVAVQPYKIIFLTPTGGLLDNRGNVISAINLTEDFDHLIAQPWVHSGMKLKLEEIRNLLGQLPDSSSVSITSPEHLAKELFTYQGSGTLIRRGEHIRRLDSIEGIDLPRLAGLLEACFGRRLIADYFNSREFLRIYLADSYRATAIVTNENATPYLDKFAVTAEAQGVGLGGSMWSRMREDFPRLFWRSRAGNTINPWYFQQAQGSYRTSEWVVFWYGLDSYDEIRSCVEYALALPPSLHAAVV